MLGQDPYYIQRRQPSEYLIKAALSVAIACIAFLIYRLADWLFSGSHLTLLENTWASVIAIWWLWVAMGALWVVALILSIWEK
jgi:hypothetical protein